MEDGWPVSGMACAVLDCTFCICRGEALLFLLLSLAAEDVRGDTRPC